MKTQTQIFLVHASEDKESVRNLHAQLEGYGFKPWLDEIDIVPGQNWRVEIPKAIKESDVLLACLSKRSVEKEGYVQRELRLALNACAEKPPGRIYLIPVKLDDCEVPDLQLLQLGMSLRDIQWVDLWKDDGFDSLIGAIERAVGQSDRSETSKRLQAADVHGLEIASPFIVSTEILLEAKTGRSVDIVSIYVHNRRADKTFDDVRVELRLPARIAFVHAEAARGEKPLFDHVTVPLSSPVHPGSSRKIGYVKKHLDLDNLMAGILGATENSDALEWKITARDVPATSGDLDVSRLNRD